MERKEAKRSVRPFELFALDVSVKDTLIDALKLKTTDLPKTKLVVAVLATTLTDDSGFALLFEKGKADEKTNKPTLLVPKLEIPVSEDAKHTTETWADAADKVIRKTLSTPYDVARDSPVPSNVYVRLDESSKDTAEGRIIPVVISIPVESKKWGEKVVVCPVLHLIEYTRHPENAPGQLELSIGRKGVQIEKMAPDLQKDVPVSVWLEYFTRTVALSLEYVSPMYTVARKQIHDKKDIATWVAYQFITQKLDSRKHATEIDKAIGGLHAHLQELIRDKDAEDQVFAAIRLSQECAREDLPKITPGIFEKVKEIPSAIYDREFINGATYRHYILKRADIERLTDRAKVLEDMSGVPLKHTVYTKNKSVFKLLQSTSVDVSDEINHLIFKRATKRIAHVAFSTSLSLQLGTGLSHTKAGVLLLAKPVRRALLHYPSTVYHAVRGDGGKPERKQDPTSCAFPEDFADLPKWLSSPISDKCAISLLKAFACQFPEPHWWSDARIAQFLSGFTDNKFTPNDCITWLARQTGFDDQNFEIVFNEKKQVLAHDTKILVKYVARTQTFEPVLTDQQDKLDTLWRGRTYLIPFLAWKEKMMPAGGIVFHSGQNHLYRDMFAITSVQVDVDPTADLFGGFNISILQSPTPKKPVYLSPEQKQDKKHHWYPKFFQSTTCEQETFVCYRKLQLLQMPTRPAETRCSSSAYLTNSPEFMKHHTETVFIQLKPISDPLPTYIAILVFHDKGFVRTMFPQVSIPQMNPEEANKQTRYVRQMSDEYGFLTRLRNGNRIGDALKPEGTNASAIASFVKYQLRLLLAKYCKHSAVVLMGKIKGLSYYASEGSARTAAIGSFLLTGYAIYQYSPKDTEVLNTATSLGIGAMASLAVELFNQPPSYQQGFWKKLWNLTQVPAVTNATFLAVSTGAIHLTATAAGGAIPPIVVGMISQVILRILLKTRGKGPLRAPTRETFMEFVRSLGVPSRETLAELAHAGFIGVLGGLQQNFGAAAATEIAPAAALGWLGQIASYIGAGESVPWLGPLLGVGALLAGIATKEFNLEAFTSFENFTKQSVVTWNQLWPKFKTSADAASISVLFSDLHRLVPASLLVIYAAIEAGKSITNTDLSLPISGDVQETGGYVHISSAVLGLAVGIGLVCSMIGDPIAASGVAAKAGAAVVNGLM